MVDGVWSCETMPTPDSTQISHLTKMGCITSNVALAPALSFILGVVFCSCCTFFAHLALSPLPVDGKWYISTFVMAVIKSRGSGGDYDVLVSTEDSRNRGG